MIVGIDPSLVGTGVCILDNTKQMVHIETISTKLDGVTRLIGIQNALHTSLLKFLSKSMSFTIFIEGYAFMAKGRSVFNLGELGGILRVYLAKTWGGYYEVPPTSLKKFVCSKGNAKKEIMLEQTFKKYHIGSETLKDNNQVDAFGLAQLGWSYIHREETLAKYELEALGGVGEKCAILST
jgi:Holliday junction resolvasome RuvABC endonuclease subunit